jgi:hypothetical protein
MFFYKTPSNEWVRIGSADWASSWPTIQASEADPTLTVGDVLTLNINDQYELEVEVDEAPNNTVSVMAAAINTILNFFIVYS